MLPATRDVPAAQPVLNVLVVEDDERSGQMLAGLLRRDGFHVEVCAGGLSGLQRIASEPALDVLVTDLRMPQIDGITVARLARDHSPDMPILIVTAYPDLAGRLAGARPAPQVFVKPLDYPALVEALRGIQRSKHA
jgi:CheY-like chemotaxis protein